MLRAMEEQIEEFRGEIASERMEHSQLVSGLARVAGLAATAEIR